MAWFTTGDVEEYLAVAGGLLAARPAENTVLLTVAETVHARGPAAYGPHPPVYGWWQPGDEDGAVEAAFLVTPPYPVLVTRMPAPAVSPLADVLAELGQPPSGVNAGAGTAELLADAVTVRTGASWQTRQRHRLHRLGELRPPDPAPEGGARVATAADTDLLVAWSEAFVQETGDHGGDSQALVADRISYQGFLLWCAAGRPVSLAGMSRQLAGTVRIGPVYTPPDHRRHGYAGAVTAAISRAALDAGAREVVLFTDLANPTSNALYQRLGYQPVQDRHLLTFLPPQRTA